jgi:hypothetical protein
MYKGLDIFAKADADPDVLANLGPLRPLAGIWEGDEGIDIAPSANGAAEHRFRERMIFEPMGPVQNGPQTLYGLRYATTAWPLGEQDAFHEEQGYWLWEPAERQIMRCFIVPRGVTVNAGGTAAADANAFELFADVGSELYGITSNPYLGKTKRTVRYELQVTIHADGRFSYAEDTQLEIDGQQALFHHTDSNTLTKVG